MNPNEKPSNTFHNKDQEQNILAVKHPLKQHKRAHLFRRNEYTYDLIDVVGDGKILGRHIPQMSQ